MIIVCSLSASVASAAIKTLKSCFISCRIELLLLTAESAGSKVDLFPSLEEAQSESAFGNNTKSQLKEVHTLTSIPYCKDKAALQVSWVPNEKVWLHPATCKSKSTLTTLLGYHPYHHV